MLLGVVVIVVVAVAYLKKTFVCFFFLNKIVSFIVLCDLTLYRQNIFLNLVLQLSHTKNEMNSLFLLLFIFFFLFSIFFLFVLKGDLFHEMLISFITKPLSCDTKKNKKKFKMLGALKTCCLFGLKRLIPLTSFQLIEVSVILKFAIFLLRCLGLMPNRGAGFKHKLPYSHHSHKLQFKL